MPEFDHYVQLSSNILQHSSRQLVWRTKFPWYEAAREWDSSLRGLLEVVVLHTRQTTGHRDRYILKLAFFCSFPWEGQSGLWI